MEPKKVTIPEDEMRIQALSCLQYGNSFFETLQKSVRSKKSKFGNELLYNLAVMCIEKYFVALLARYDWNATHHMPVALYREAKDYEPELTESMKQTTILVGKFEGICSLEDFGYKTPNMEELTKMCEGLEEIKNLVEKRIGEIEVFP